MTYDIDIVAVVPVRQASQLVSELGPDWYAEPGQISDSIAAGRAFNIIHRSEGVKIDVFPALEAFHFQQLDRATWVALPFMEDDEKYPVLSAEDVLLAKLQWYKSGGCVSDRQWGDITGVIGANPNLDKPYLQDWAGKLGVTDLLSRALAEMSA
jgi:hypothetical protein